MNGRMSQDDGMPWWYLTRTPKQSLWLGIFQLLPLAIVCFVLLSGIDPNPPVWSLLLTAVWASIGVCYLVSGLARPGSHRQTPVDSAGPRH